MIPSLLRRPAAFLLPPLASALFLAACSPQGPATYSGYVEGDYLYLAAPQAGYLATLDVPRGRRVAPGTRVFAIAQDPDKEALAEAEAKTGAAREKLANLQAPRRASEIATLEAQLAAAEANLRLSLTQFAQQQALAHQHFVSQARLDEATAARDRDRAQVEAARQQLANYRQSLGRQAELAGAQADWAAAAAQAAQKRWAVERKTVQAPVAGEISDTYYRPGEWVGAGQPVAALLPDARRRLRFFVPETALARFTPGTRVEAHCDGCTRPVAGVVDFVAAQAEYTPPVIYSQGSREKLVFRVEAAPAPDQAPGLHPGQPIDVTLAGGQKP